MKRILFLSFLASFCALFNSTIVSASEYHSDSPYYIEAHLGYSIVDWSKDATSLSGIVALDPSIGYVTNTTNGRGGFSGVLDFGYRFNKYFSAEIGYVYLPSSEEQLVLTTGPNPEAKGEYDSWFSYVTGKFSYPVFENVDIYTKVGLAYRSVQSKVDVKVGSTNAHDKNASYWAPVFTLGGDYPFNDNWALGIQYLYLPGYHELDFSNSSSKSPAPEVHLVTLGLNYSFGL